MSRALLPSILAAQNLPSQSASHEVRIFWDFEREAGDLPC